MIKWFSLILAILTISIGFYSCSDDVINPGNNNGSGAMVKTTVIGIVQDENGNVLNGVEITIGDQTRISNNNGLYIFQDINVPQKRVFVKASRYGCFNAISAAIPNANSVTQISISMLTMDVTYNLNGGTGGTVTLPDGTSIQIQGNSLQLSSGVTYTGDVYIISKTIDPTSEEFPLVVPGGDLLARRSDSSDAILSPYSIVNTEIYTQSGEKLYLKPGNTSTITFSIPAGLIASAPASLPLWYFDENTGMWKEDGSAQKQGDKYIGNVSHFTCWGCLKPYYSATIKGRVVDCNNRPLPSAIILTGYIWNFTNAQGYFQRLAPVGEQFIVGAHPIWNHGLFTISPFTVGPLANQQVYDMGNIKIDCPQMFVLTKGKVICGNQPVFNAILLFKNSENEVSSTYTEGDGTYRLTTKANTNYEVFAFKHLASAWKTITTTQSGDTTIVDDILLCDTTSSDKENCFTINGDGFNNENVFFPEPLNAGYYMTEYNSTSISVQRTYGDSALFGLLFPGNQTGTFDSTNSNSNIYVGVMYQLKYYYMRFMPYSITVDEYGPVGGFIIGRFNGILYRDNTIPVNITNGKFKVRRLS